MLIVIVRWCVNVNSVRVDGVHPLRCVLLLNGGGVCCCCPAPSQWCSPCPTHPTAVLASTAVVSPTVTCQVCGVWVVCAVCVVFVWWGILCPFPPSRWWWVGPSWMVGWHCSGGWHGFGRAGVVMVTLPSVVSVPLLFAWWPLLNGGRGCVLWCPCVRWGLVSCIVLFLLHCPTLRCVCCHSIVGLVPCVCGRVVSLWNGGDGLWVVTSLVCGGSTCLVVVCCVIVEWRWCEGV